MVQCKDVHARIIATWPMQPAMNPGIVYIIIIALCTTYWSLKQDDQTKRPGASRGCQANWGDGEQERRETTARNRSLLDLLIAAETYLHYAGLWWRYRGRGACGEVQRDGQQGVWLGVDE